MLVCRRPTTATTTRTRAPRSSGVRGGEGPAPVVFEDLSVLEVLVLPPLFPEGEGREIGVRHVLPGLLGCEIVDLGNTY